MVRTFSLDLAQALAVVAPPEWAAAALPARVVAVPLALVRVVSAARVAAVPLVWEAEVPVV